VLLAFASMQFLYLPLAFYKAYVVAYVAQSDPATPPFARGRGLAEALEFGSLLGPLVGVAVIVYDRRRATREDRISGNLCMSCGYDLRATPDRCPECGAVDGRSAI
jgi:hypothetical protein